MFLILNFMLFIGLLIALGFSPITLNDTALNWEDTINYSYGSTVSLSFVALHVVLNNFSGSILFFLSIKHISNEHTDGNPLLDRTRGPDYSSR